MSMLLFIAITALVLAAIPCGLFFLNLRHYRPARPYQPNRFRPPPISVLIPARNEAANIGSALESVLANEGVDFEVVVLDDASEDATPAVIKAFASRDSRVRLAEAPQLPPGWCGKQHACHVLSGLASHTLFVFMDADVRLHPHALWRMAQHLDQQEVDLLSGFPRQLTGTWLERLLIPLIHFVLLGFLPMGGMRRSRHPRYSAGCGQLFMARAASYHRAGGHAAIRATLHDGLNLPRAFRRHGLRTDLLDATDIATCRMYHSAAEVWHGLGKNATEGLGAPRTIVPATMLLFGGQVLPWLLVPALLAPWSTAQTFILAAIALSALPRWVIAWRFRQSPMGALAHPLGVLLLLVIQWLALVRSLRRQPPAWKGRSYPHPSPALCVLALALLLAGPADAQDAARFAPPKSIPPFSLHDQHDKSRSLAFPLETITVITVADRKGSKQIEAWVRPIRQRYDTRIGIEGVADMSNVPGPLKPMVRRAFRDQLNYPVMLDWEGKVSAYFGYVPREANVYLLDRQGNVRFYAHGKAGEKVLQQLFQTIDQELKRTANTK